MGKFELPKLSYAYNALEPSIDKMTMEIHHSKHHAGYVTKLNGAVEGSDLEGKSIEQLLSNVSKHSPAVRNNGGGHFNHTLFWTIMGPGGSKPEGALADAIKSAFQSFDEFKNKYRSCCDVLLLEDIHMLSGRTRTQEELRLSLLAHSKILDELAKRDVTGSQNANREHLDQFVSQIYKHLMPKSMYAEGIEKFYR